MAEFIRVGGRSINLAHIVTTEAVDEIFRVAFSSGVTIAFEEGEAKALKAWFERSARDIVQEAESSDWPSSARAGGRRTRL